jgi:hypothetical protein
MMDLDLCNDCR